MSEEYESYLYAVIFDQGSVKVGCSSDVDCRTAEHIRSGVKFGIQATKVLSQLIQGGAGTAEQKLISLCVKDSRQTFNQEWFKYPSAEEAINKVAAHFAEATGADPGRGARKDRRPSQAMTDARTYFKKNPMASAQELSEKFGLHVISVYRSVWWREARAQRKGHNLATASTDQNKETP